MVRQFLKPKHHHAQCWSIVNIFIANMPMPLSMVLCNTCTTKILMTWFLGQGPPTSSKCSSWSVFDPACWQCFSKFLHTLTKKGRKNVRNLMIVQTSSSLSVRTSSAFPKVQVSETKMKNDGMLNVGASSRDRRLILRSTKKCCT